MPDTVPIPVRDIRMPGSKLGMVELNELLRKYGFVFVGEIDENGRQNAHLPKGWTKKEKSPRRILAIDNFGNVRLEIISKIPWGRYDFIHFIMILNEVSTYIDPTKIILPVLDIRYSKSDRSPEEWKEYISMNFRFIFTGEVDADGIQSAIMCSSWTVKRNGSPMRWSYVDPCGVERMFVDEREESITIVSL